MSPDRSTLEVSKSIITPLSIIANISALSFGVKLEVKPRSVPTLRPNKDIEPCSVRPSELASLLIPTSQLDTLDSEIRPTPFSNVKIGSFLLDIPD